MNDNPYETLDIDLPGQELNDDKLYITEEICEHWLQSSRWTSGLATMIFVGFALFILLICMAGAISVYITSGFIVFAMVSGFILFFIGKNLYRYSVRIREAADHAEWEAMETAFSSLSDAYAIYGMVVVLGTLAMVFVFINALVSNF